MKKTSKLLVFLCCCTLAVLLGSGVTQAYADIEPTSGEINNISWTLNSDGVLTFALIDPNESGEMPQVQSYQHWRQHSGDITSVVIESGVTSISIAAFSGCGSLTEITIPASVTSIGSEAFSGCTSLESVTLTDNVTTVGGYMAFYRGIKVHVPTARGSAAKAVTSAGGNYYLAEDTSFALQCSDAGVVTLKSYTGEETAVEIPGHVDAIGNKAFQNNGTVTAVTIPSSVTSMGQYAFEGCSALETVTIQGSGLNNIGYFAFRSCSALSSINIPASVTEIEAGAFYGCSALPSLTLTDNVAAAGSYAFQGANNLKIYVPTLRGSAAKAVTDAGASYYLTSDTDNVYALQCSGEGLVTLKGYAGEDTELTIDWVDAIGYGVFQGNDTLTSLTLTGVTGMDRYVFYECYSLKTLIFTDDSLTSIGSSAFSRTSNDLRIYVPTANGSTARAVSSQADHFYVAGDEDFALTCGSDGAVTLKRYEGEDTNLTLPGHINVLSERVFQGNTALESVTMPGVTAIGNYTFKGCTGLTGVTLPATLNSIGWEAFGGCTGLTEIAIPAAAASIGGSAFNGCTELTTVSIANGSALAEIGERAFQNCGKLTGIAIPATVTGIGGYAFEGCAALETVTFGADSQLAAINSYTFRNCSSLTAISIPAAVTSIGYDAFDGCAELETVTFGAGSQLTTLVNGVFRNCESLTEIVLPDSLTNIGSNSFYRCAALTEITIPANVSTMGENAFRETGVTSVTFEKDCALTVTGSQAFKDCASLTTVNFGSGSALTTVSEKTFEGCSNLNTINLPASLTTIGSYAFNGCASLNDANIISDGVETIGNNAFWSCTGLTGVNIPASVTTLSNSAFNNCTNLSTVTFAAGSTLDKIDQYVFWGCESLTSINIPATVASIGNNAFQGCAALTGIDIPDAVTSIGSYAFSESGLTSVVISENVSEMGNYAFGSCPNLTTVSLPENGGLTAISWGAFNGCASLTTINIPSTVTYLGTYAFSGCTSLEDLYLPASVTSISASFHGLSNIKVHVPSYDGDTAKAVSNADTNFYVGEDTSLGLRYAGDNVHLNRYTGTAAEAALPDYVTGIGSSAAFSGSPMKKLTVTDSLSSVAAYLSFGSGADDVRVYVPTPDGSAAKAISNIYTMSSGSSTVYFVTGYDDLALQCRGDDPVTLRRYVGTDENVVLPEFVKVIHESAFSGNTTMKSVTLTNVSTIEKWAFWQCAALETATLNEGVTSIGTQVFSGCSSLTAVNIPATVTSIEGSAFSGCDSLPSLTLTDNITYIGAYGMCPDSVRVYVPTPDGSAARNVSNPSYGSGHDYYVIGDDAFALRCNADGAAVTLKTYTGSAENVFTPDYVSVIGQSAFSGNTTVKNVTLTNVTTIEKWAFWGCTALEKVTLSEGLTEITTQTFSGCTNLSSVNIPDSVTSIYDSAFEGISNLRLSAWCGSYGEEWAASHGFGEDLGDDPVTGKQLRLLHAWSEPSYVWNEEHTEVTAARVCQRDESHEETETADAASEITLAPTCTEMGQTTYTSASFENTAFAVQTVTLTDVVPLGHDWCEPNYTWNGDYTSVTADRVCHRDGSHVETETAAATGQTTKEATCTGKGKTTYTSAAFENAAFSVQAVTRSDIPALGHDWDEPTYVWNDAYSQATACRICKRDGNHRQTETVDAASDVTLAPTCTEMGQTTYTSSSFVNTAFSVQTAVLTDVPALGHDWGAITYRWQNNYTELKATCVCARNASHVETETVEADAEITTPPTCTAMGKTTYTSKAFTFEAFKVQTLTLMNIPALGHKWAVLDSTAAGSGDGVRGGVVCDACGEVQTESRPVSAQKVLRVPGMLETIEEEAFAGIAAQQVTLSAGVQTIGSRAFAGCGGLLLAVIPSSVASIADDAFADCDIAVICPQGSFAADWCDARLIPHNP